MQLNRFEKFLVNNPARWLHQRWIESTLLRSCLPRRTWESALFIGCGDGAEVTILGSALGPKRIDAFDIDADQIQRARHRLSRLRETQIRTWVGDAARTTAGASQYDLAVNWGVFHHVPNWRRAIAQAVRALKPGGWFLFFEVPGHKITSRVYRALFDHPLEDRFEWTDFQEECERAGLRFNNGPPRKYFGFFYGAARKPLIGADTPEERDPRRE